MQRRIVLICNAHWAVAAGAHCWVCGAGRGGPWRVRRGRALDCAALRPRWLVGWACEGLQGLMERAGAPAMPRACNWP
jgi:hypothetical protein